MFKSIKLLIIIFITSCFHENVYSQQTGLIKIGCDYLTNNNYEITKNGEYSLNHSGLSVGILIPIHIKCINIFYKVDITSHKVLDIINPSQYNWYNRDLYDKHISGLNELLVGKSISLSDNQIILPQTGIGFQMESLYRKSPRDSYESIIYSAVMLDFSICYLITKRDFMVGVMANYSNAVTKSTFVYDATNRIGLSLILGK